MIAKDINSNVLDYDQKVKLLDFNVTGIVIEFLEDNLVTVKYNNTYRDVKANRLEII